jgi:hypothetical protein
VHSDEHDAQERGDASTSPHPLIMAGVLRVR